MREEKKIKCLIWDLDNTLWDGVLLEDKEVSWNEEAVAIIKTLDQRGILHSIASRNDRESVLQELKKKGLLEYFLYPQIHWQKKSSSIASIAKNLNLGLDALAFIDDQAFELDEVAAAHPDVLCIPSSEMSTLLSRAEFQPHFITEDSRKRRKMMQDDQLRNEEESNFSGDQSSFLSTLNLKMRISFATEADLQRAEELTVRTNQLNTTGKTYSYEELLQFCNSPNHELLIVELRDKYGDYGKIGLALLELVENNCFIRLLLMSCRVMSRGIGTIMINYFRLQAKQSGWNLYADFEETDRNRLMYMTYRFNGFEPSSDNLLKNNLAEIPNMPGYMDIDVPDEIFSPEVALEESVL